MPVPRPDPAPRNYPDFVTLLRRAEGGAAAAPAQTSLDETEAWLLAGAIDSDDLLLLFESFIWRLVAAGLPLDRASLHVGTLHPQLFGFAWNWTRSDVFCDEVKVDEASLQTEAYRRNPLYRVIQYGESVRGRVADTETVKRFPLLADLAAQGFSEYLCLPLRAGGTYHNAATAATKQPGGFTDAQFAGLSRLLRLFALHVERHIALRIAGNVLDTYLGSAAGGRVLRGAIKRGSGEAIRAIVWASDLRGFTDLADRLPGSDMTALLNAYFERLVGAVIAHDGEVLKFIGDGLLAVFPYSAFADERAAAGAALAAAEQAVAALEALNADPPPDLARIADWQPLRTGIALHDGEVFFGNVGAPERLDFTVIGRAVNAAARVEALSKTLGRAILLTEPVARRLDQPLDDLGEHPLRGLAQPLRVFSPGK
ncbi:MAG: adenylate/guanylate cyclase domain-containing protein [Kiloniellaceae bacterium]|nr:adenylate/guanylate cyclase domain-containing protein [Kiloniellaceae bacterium]